MDALTETRPAEPEAGFEQPHIAHYLRADNPTVAMCGKKFDRPSADAPPWMEDCVVCKDLLKWEARYAA